MDKRRVLEHYYGYSEFRPGQEELIDGVLAGRDVFGIMPTGGGKSICYQIPGLMLPGITLVISPLISLMQDQVLALRSLGIPAAYINSTLSATQIQAVQRKLLDGAYKIVYIAPERLDYSGFSNLLSRLDISFIAVDEAHCISQWGQDFRPSYLRIVNFIDELPRRPVVGAFTATATRQVREDVERILKLRSPVCVVTGFDRPNLSFEVRRPGDKDAELLHILSKNKDKSGIIYCATRKNVESVCQILCGHGYAATRYHAGLDEQERAANQEDFVHDRRPVMVATNAFGMGIDKSNVGFVIHYNMPKSIEAYYQEAGRAGRDGADAACILLYSNADVTTARFLINNSVENEEMDPQEREWVRQQDMERLSAMVGYCKTIDCLRGYILDYFGQAHSESCGNCGNCNTDYMWVDMTREAQMILSCVKRIYDQLGYYVGITTVVRTLHGGRDKRVVQLGLDDLSTYGLMKSIGRTRIRAMIDHLETEGYLFTETEHQTLRLTPKAAQVLYRGESVQIPVVNEQKVAPAPKAAGDTGLYDALRALRMDLAREAKVPAYVVFSNATLQDMARKKPRTLADFMEVSGVGEVKAARYADAFLRRIRAYLDEEASR